LDKLNDQFGTTAEDLNFYDFGTKVPVILIFIAIVCDELGFKEGEKWI
jgi:hypothetical protein